MNCTSHKMIINAVTFFGQFEASPLARARGAVTHELPKIRIINVS